jgi:dimethylhistidine N-methyltransferase
MAPPQDQFRAEVLRGLSRPRKRLPCKFLYDERGSRLFERICDLEEYYPTRTEQAIMRRYAHAMAAAAGSNCLLIEYGSGSSLKTRILLDHLPSPAGYVPIDISRAHLLHSARALAVSYPHVPVLPLCGDYTLPLALPAGCDRAARRVAYFPGSTIGNFEPPQAVRFLSRVRDLCGKGGGLLIGVDLTKPPHILHAAYNDAAGVTAEFNLNLLCRINRELGADFDLGAFAHYAIYNPRPGRIEMHLVSLAQQTVRIGRDDAFRFARGEGIHTESSYKHTLEGFARLAQRAGYHVQQVWTDDRAWFSVQYLVAR